MTGAGRLAAAGTMAMIKTLRIAAGLVFHGAAKAAAFKRDLGHRGSCCSYKREY